MQSRITPVQGVHRPRRPYPGPHRTRSSVLAKQATYSTHCRSICEPNIVRGTGTSNSRHFTGHERDWQTATSENPDGIDYMGARYANLGRFSQVDTAPGLLYAPQMFNRYTYALN